MHAIYAEYSREVLKFAKVDNPASWESDNAVIVDGQKFIDGVGPDLRVVEVPEDYEPYDTKQLQYLLVDPDRWTLVRCDPSKYTEAELESLTKDEIEAVASELKLKTVDSDDLKGTMVSNFLLEVK